MPGIRELQQQAALFAPGDARREKIERAIERKRTKRDRPSPTKLAKEELTRRGWAFDVVEQRVPGCFVTRDFCNFADIVFFAPLCGIVALQVTGDTDGGNHAKRLAKCAAEPRALTWLRSGGGIQVWSFSLRGARCKEKLWTLRISRAVSNGDGIEWREVEV